MEKDFIVRRSITVVEGKPHVEIYSEQELVRYKDCKYGRKPILSFRTDCVWCERIQCHNSNDWFCADGERRADDA